MSMARFLFLYRGPTDKDAYAKTTPDDMQKLMQKWVNWIKEALQQGWMVEPGDALKPHEGRVVNSKKVVSDGPFVEAKECVGGFSIVQADSIEAAAEHAKGCPGLLTGGTVEVRPLAEVAIKF
jgi:hypothetical protein